MKRRPVLKVLDLFSGLGGWAQPFRDRGHDVTTLDLEPAFLCTITADVRTVSADALLAAGYGPFDLILASPPCTGFSVASIGRHWLKAKGMAPQPKTEQARLGITLVEQTLRLIRDLQPRWWVMENPRGMMRNLDLLAGLSRVTVTFCHYGETRMKPTDLWGGFPPSWVPEPACKNGDPCHEAAPRGSLTGTQGIKGAAARAVIPYALALSICEAAEHDR